MLRTLPVLLSTLLLAVAPPHARASPPLYSGTYVIVDPYNFNDMTFLKCASEATPDAKCSGQSASNSDYLNPFTGVTSSHASYSPGANGILLRIPWCAFQTNAVGAGQAAPVLGECHYQVRGANGIGTLYAGAYGNVTDQLYPAGATGLNPQGGTDDAINNLSTCTSRYDTAGPHCAASQLDAALGYIATLASHLPPGTLKLSVSLMAGMYTPTSVMGAVTTLDFPQKEGSSTSCAPQPLAWHTTATRPYVATAYETAYTGALLALGHEIHAIFAAAGTAVQLDIIKQSAITSNSSEFDVAATNAIIPTAIDPSQHPPPQGGSIVQCPDRIGQTMVTALLDAYAYTRSPLAMADAYEYTFGYVAGFSRGLSAQSGAAAGALLSVPTKGAQVFAHIDCGLAGSTACVADPTTRTTYERDWNEYYFSKFMDDFNTSGTPATIAAAAGYRKACAGVTCTPATLATIAPASLSVVFTGLDVTANPGDYTAGPECWVNNTNPNRAYALRLYQADGTAITQPILGTGIVLGWQTRTHSGQYCPSHYNLNQTGLKNGGQFLEIETDAASETQCAISLKNALNTLLAPTGNTRTTCAY